MRHHRPEETQQCDCETLQGETVNPPLIKSHAQEDGSLFICKSRHLLGLVVQRRQQSSSRSQIDTAAAMPQF